MKPTPPLNKVPFYVATCFPLLGLLLIAFLAPNNGLGGAPILAIIVCSIVGFAALSLPFLTEFKARIQQSAGEENETAATLLSEERCKLERATEAAIASSHQSARILENAVLQASKIQEQTVAMEQKFSEILGQLETTQSELQQRASEWQRNLSVQISESASHIGELRQAMDSAKDEGRAQNEQLQTTLQKLPESISGLQPILTEAQQTLANLPQALSNGVSTQLTTLQSSIAQEIQNFESRLNSITQRATEELTQQSSEPLRHIDAKIKTFEQVAREQTDTIAQRAGQLDAISVQTNTATSNLTDLLSQVRNVSTEKIEATIAQLETLLGRAEKWVSELPESIVVQVPVAVPPPLSSPQNIPAANVEMAVSEQDAKSSPASESVFAEETGTTSDTAEPADAVIPPESAIEEVPCETNESTVTKAASDSASGASAENSTETDIPEETTNIAHEIANEESSLANSLPEPDQSASEILPEPSTPENEVQIATIMEPVKNSEAPKPNLPSYGFILDPIPEDPFAEIGAAMDQEISSKRR